MFVCLSFGQRSNFPRYACVISSLFWPWAKGATSTPFRLAKPWMSRTKDLVIGLIKAVDVTFAPLCSSLKKVDTPPLVRSIGWYRFRYILSIPSISKTTLSSNNSPMVCFIIVAALVDNMMDTSVLPRLAITKVYPFVGSTGAPLYQARMRNCLPLDHIMPCRFEVELR